jgi:hypothetical protein
MFSLETITPRVDRSDGRLQPTQPGAALIRRASVCFPDDPDAAAAKVHRFGFVSRGFKQSVHIFAPGLKSSGNHPALFSAKLNQVRLDGEPHNSFGFLSAASVVNGHDELTQRQDFLPAIGFHGRKC